MNSTQLRHRTYETLTRSRLATRAALRTTVLGKRLAPTTEPHVNGEIRLLGQLADGVRVAADVGEAVQYGDAWKAASSTLRAAQALLSDAGYRSLAIAPGGLREFHVTAVSECNGYANFVTLAPATYARVGAVESIW